MKRTITLFSLLMIMVTGIQGQYFYIPHTNAGTNPGGINTDDEYPVGGGLPAGWTTISASGSNPTPVWTGAQTIPFSFSFNGTAVTQYKVSSSAVLTFDVASVLAAPAYAKAALPDASIPDNSVCIWGLASLGTNDYIITKTFGTAPNRQHWIQFSSYGYGTSPSDGNNFTYWSIVLEETSNKIYIVDARTGGYATTKNVSAGVQVNSTTAVSVAGSPNLAALAGTNATSVDNTYYEFIAGVLPANDANFSDLSPSAGSPSSYGITSGQVSLSAKLTNYGSATITAIDFKYFDGVNTYTDNVTGLNLASFTSTVLTHNTPYTIPSVGNHPINVWFELSGDLNQSNDSGATNVQGVSFIPTHVVVFEEGTGTWCGWCPRGSVFMDSMNSVNPNQAILIAVHNSDPMVNAIYDNGVGGIISGYPSVLVNRNIIADPSDMFTQFNDHINDFGVADLAVTTNYNAVTHSTTTDVSAHFAADVSGDYRLAVVFTEDDLTGTTSTWAQSNYYSFQSQNIALQGAGHNWQSEPNPVPAANMEYDHVARTILGGFNGQAGSLPASIVAGATHSYSFNYTVPLTSDITRMHVYGLLIDVNSNRILNGSKGTIILGVDEPGTSQFNVSLFPNPAAGYATLNFNLQNHTDMVVEVIDILGNVVNTLNPSLAAGNQRVSFDLTGLATGVYSVKVSANGESISRKLIVTN